VLLRGSFVSCYLAAQLDCFLEHYLEQHAGVDNSSRRKKRRRFPGVVPLRCPFTRVLPLSSCFFHMIKARKKKHCFDGKKIIFFSPAFALFLSVQSEQTPPIILDYFDFKEYPNSWPENGKSHKWNFLSPRKFLVSVNPWIDFMMNLMFVLKKNILFLIYLVIPRTFKIKERQFPSTVDWHFLERWLGG